MANAGAHAGGDDVKVGTQLARRALARTALALVLCCLPLVLPPAAARAGNGPHAATAVAPLALAAPTPAPLLAASSGHGSGGIGFGGPALVLVFVAILMAVAIPVFLGQKAKATSSASEQNVKHVVDTIESCAAGSMTGEIDSGGTHCASAAQITRDEPSLASIVVQGCTNDVAAGVVCVEANGSDSYRLTTTAVGSGAPTFSYERTATNVTKSCTPSGAPGCSNGTW